MKNIFILITVSCLCLTFSCKHTTEEVLPTNKSVGFLNIIASSLGTVGEYPGSISYIAFGSNGPMGKHAYYKGYAEFFNDSTLTGKVEDVGQVYFGNIAINTNPSRWGVNTYHFEAADMTNSTNSSQWGTNVTFGIAGGSSTYSGFNTSFYVPEVIYFDTISYVCGSPSLPPLSISSPPTLTWNADGNNTNVAIVIIYDGVASNQLNSSLSNQSFSQSLVTNDNGSYGLTSSDLASFTSGAIVDVYVGRCGEDVVVSNGKKINIIAYTYSKRRYLLVN